MQHLTIPRHKPAERSAGVRYKGTRPQLAHITQALDPPFALWEDDACEPYLVVTSLAVPHGLGRALADDVKWGSRDRTGGLITRSEVFGTRTRNVLMKQEYHGACTFNGKFPHLYAQLRRLGEDAAATFARTMPTAYAAQVATVQRIRPEYRPWPTWTSGILNLNSALPYHRDGGNIERTLNAMLVLRDRVDGGDLAVPGIDAKITCPDGALFLFPAREMLHGVLPLAKRHHDGYRISVVFYALHALFGAGSPEEELAYAQRKRTEREQRRAGLIP